MQLETRTLYSLLLTLNGLGAPRAPPPERSGAERGSWGPASDGERGPRGRSPPDPVGAERGWRGPASDGEPAFAKATARSRRSSRLRGCPRTKAEGGPRGRSPPDGVRPH